MEKLIDIKKLVPDDHNFNKGTEQGRELVKQSFEKYGAGRSVLLDKDDRLIAGNKATEGAIASGKIKKVRVIETDGSELIAVKRTDVSLDSKEGREMALLDNLTTQVNLAWDEAELRTVADEVPGFDVSDFGVDIDAMPHVDFEPTGETEEQMIERKRKEFEERMASGELSEDDPEYQEFLKKFEAKRTTDDCYTPELVYDAIADWVAKEYNVSRANFVRPFYPGGDYQKEKYKANDIVVDNPPFSILMQVVRFFLDKRVRFFLFAPSVTCLNATKEPGVTALCTGAQVTYDNGANVNTSFLTSLEPSELAARTAPPLYAVIKEANEKVMEKMHKQLPTYSYPDNIFTAAMGNKYSKYGQDFRVLRSQSQPISELDAQKGTGKAIYGNGLLLSDKAAAEKAAAEKAAAEKAAATRWELSDREREIVAQLNQK